MGLLGAVAGGAKGFGGFISAELQAERERAMEALRQDNRLAMEEVRTTNRRETNRLNNEQQNDFRLGQLAQSDEYARDRIEMERPSMQDETLTFEEDGQPSLTMYGQRNTKTNEFTPYRRPDESKESAYGGGPAEAQLVEYYRQEHGMSPEDAREFVKTSAKDGASETYNRMLADMLKDTADPVRATQLVNDAFRSTEWGAYWGDFNYSDVLRFKAANPGVPDEQIRAFMEDQVAKGRRVTGAAPQP